MKIIKVNDKMQKNYSYTLSAPIGKKFNPQFKPDLTPREMLRLGVFGGKYMTDCKKEFPASWFKSVKFSPDFHDAKINFFGVNASQSLSVWRRNGWVSKEDPRGWFQWYCRYYIGRRLEKEDVRQIKRWLAMRRHIAQLTRSCRKGDFSCRAKQRQALLHWAFDSRKM